jgi:DNA-binding GntR family transcriptional regulator
MVLADRHGVSRGPMRKAFQARYASRLVEITPNRGAFVRQFTRHDAVAIHEVRAGVFGTACRLPSDRITSVQIAGLRSLVTRMDVAGAQRDLDAHVPLKLVFPASIVNGTGNLILVRI